MKILRQSASSRRVEARVAAAEWFRSSDEHQLSQRCRIYEKWPGGIAGKRMERPKQSRKFGLGFS